MRKRDEREEKPLGKAENKFFSSLEVFLQRRNSRARSEAVEKEKKKGNHHPFLTGTRLSAQPIHRYLGACWFLSLSK